MNKILPLIIIVAVVVVGVVVFLNLPKGNQPVVSVTPGTSGTANPTVTPNPGPSLSVIVELMRSAPGANASESEKQAFSSRVASLGVESTMVDLRTCSPAPSIIRFKAGSRVTVKNSDSVSHTITHPIGLNVSVAARSEVSQSLNLSAGIYGYSCDGKLAGIFLVYQ